VLKPEEKYKRVAEWIKKMESIPAVQKANEPFFNFLKK